MADVRSLLRSELAARKGTSQTTSVAHRVTKKRKVDATDDLARKKMRPGDVDEESRSPTIHTPQPPSAQAIEEGEDIEPVEQESAGPELPPESNPIPEHLKVQSEPPKGSKTSQAVDESEWAAFERDVVAPTRVQQAPAAVAAAATISAAPVSAEQLAAQQEAEKKTLAQTREAEIEGEREDAARFLEDEFDEMEQLEERIRRLKHKREELRQKRATEDTDFAQTKATRLSGEISRDRGNQSENISDNEDDEDDEDDLDYDDWDNWRFR